MQRTNSDVYCRMLIEQANGGPEMPGDQPQLPVTPLYDTRSDRILSSETEEVLQLELASYIKSAASQRANSSAIRTQDKRLSQPGARVVQEELENGQIAIVEDELAAAFVSVPACALTSTGFLRSAQWVSDYESTESFTYRWFFVLSTGYVVALCACLTSE
ncbi:hypothetical protein PF008_g28176 [Phytophthora fragariae]|uniref:Uncharacterized protein n=1 Tax=Phytophthora fragariae TaxID=53985 RepID=A0A6G0QC08_9STRA|nr:hypothetical protein PF008_g28176 [Phytophthora fragariae]